MASCKVAARAQAASVRPSVAPVPSGMPRARPLVAAAAFVSQAPGAARQQAQEAQKSFLDMAVDTVLSLFDDSQEQDTASEELQLPPELKAYLDEIEAHGSGSHGGWVHSHIAERLASADDGSSE